MTQDTAPIPTTLNPIPPAVATRNGTEFHAVVEVTQSGTNFLRSISYVGGVWSGSNLTGPAAVTSALAPMANCNVKSIAVGSDLYAVYMTGTTGLAVLKRNDSGWSAVTPALAFTAIDNFTPFTDGTSLYVLVNDANTLKYAQLAGSSWNTVVLTGDHGKTTAHGPVTGSQLSAAFLGGNMHCTYQAQAVAVDGFQAMSIYGAPSSPVWQRADIIETSSLPKGVKLFLYNGYLFVAYTHNLGELEVLYFDAASQPPAWQDAYDSFGNNQIAAAQAAEVAVVNGGIFIVFPDSSGHLQTTFFMFGIWNTVQLTGSGSPIQPSAPSAITPATLDVYAGTSLHICYVAPGNVMQDVFYVFPSWYQQQLFPKLPSAT